MITDEKLAAFEEAGIVLGAAFSELKGSSAVYLEKQRAATAAIEAAKGAEVALASSVSKFKAAELARQQALADLLEGVEPIEDSGE